MKRIVEQVLLNGFKALFISSLLLGQNALASKLTPESYYAQVIKDSPFVERVYKFELLTPDQQQARAKQIKKLSDRGVASGTETSDELKTIVSEFLAISEPEALHKFLEAQDKNYPNLKNNDSRFFVALATPMMSVRSFVYRFYTLSDQLRPARAAAVTTLNNISTNLSVFMPYQHSRVVFRYLTEPHLINGQPVIQFASEGYFQSYLATIVLDAQEEAVSRISALGVTDDIVWDQRIIYGPKSFSDNIGRFQKISAAEKSLILSQMHLAMAGITSFRSYSTFNSIKLSRSMGFEFGLDSALGNPNGINMKKRVEKIRNRDYAELGARFSDYESWMDLSLGHLRKAVEELDLGYVALKNRKNDESFFMGGFGITDDKFGGLHIDQLKSMMKGRTKLRSVITGDTAVVDIPAYYANPPINLKKLYPSENGFAKNGEWEVLKVGGKSYPNARYRNYDFERPMQWPHQEYKIIFPEVKSNEELQQSMRVLSQSWGGFAGVMPFVGFFN